MPKIELYGLTKDGHEVFSRVDTDVNHVHCSKVTLRQGLEKIELGEQKFSRHQVMFDYVIGKDRCVHTNPGDTVVMYQRPGRIGETPMVMNRKSDDTKQLNVVVGYDDTIERFVVITAFMGMMAPQEPWDPHCEDKAKSEEFWATHALVPDTKTYVDIKNSLKKAKAS